MTQGCLQAALTIGPPALAFSPAYVVHAPPVQPYRLLDSGSSSWLAGVGIVAPALVALLAKRTYASEWQHSAIPFASHLAVGRPHSSVRTVLWPSVAAVLSCLPGLHGTPCLQAAAAPNRTLNLPCPALAPPAPAWRERFIIAVRIYLVIFVNLVNMRAYEVRL